MEICGREICAREICARDWPFLHRYDAPMEMRRQHSGIPGKTSGLLDQASHQAALQ